MDYRRLLKEYMRHVKEWEGKRWWNQRQFHPTSNSILTLKEWNELERVEREIEEEELDRSID
jgi:hypothetical protein